jgi:flagella basal body P-ring formation protein FlgA
MSARHAVMAFAVAVVAGISGASAASSADALRDRVGAAIVQAVAERMGDARVIVERVEIFNVLDVPGLQAVPDPEARAGTVMQFSLLAPGAPGASARVARVGRASALVHVEALHAKATRLIPRGKAIDSDDLEASTSEVNGVLLRRLPTLLELEGGRAIRDLAPGEVVTGTSMTTTPAVKSGQVVRATVTIDGVEVSAMVIAAQNGELGATIRVFNRESHRELRAKVVGDGMVEVVR